MTRAARPFVLLAIAPLLLIHLGSTTRAAEPPVRRPYNGSYTGDHLARVAFPLGGIGAGMVCLEGTGALSHVSVRNKMQFYNEPCAFAALHLRTPAGDVAKVLEGPVPRWKAFGAGGTGNGATGRTYGLPRFDSAEFLARFPFATIALRDGEVPLDVELTGWSPFVPGQADDSSLPVAVLEYRFRNRAAAPVDALFSYHAANFMADGGAGGDTIKPLPNGFVLSQAAVEKHPEAEGALAVVVEGGDATVDHCWFKGGWWDALTLVWENIRDGRSIANPPASGSCPGASLYVPFALRAGEERTLRVTLAWYVPRTTLRIGREPAGPAFAAGPSRGTGKGQQPVTGFVGSGLVNSYDPAGDEAVGTLTSPEFTITHAYIQFLVGGGKHAGTSLQLLVGDEVLRSASGQNAERLDWSTWDVAELKGRNARVRIVDQESGAWGHVNVDQVVLTARRWASADELLGSRSTWGAAVTVLGDFEGADFGEWQATGPAAPASAPCGAGCTTTCAAPPATEHVPWYAGRFRNVEELVTCWRAEGDRLRRESALFRDAFYDSTLPPEVLEAIAANLTILKSPTVLRQVDGRLWCFEGCGDDSGCCHGSCTHVWNYAQALPHLFPALERTLRETEFHECQDERGHQTFRAALPIRPVAHNFHAAADGQLGGIMKVYREWRISGDAEWLRALWPQVRQSLDYCIRTWDPRGHGVVEEPHHNTYDIEFWGPDGLCSSFYLGALTAAIEMGTFLGDDVARYRELRDRGRAFMETQLYNGEYFFQQVQTEGLLAKFEPLRAADNGPGYGALIATINEQGPKYQYGTGCLSDGVLGFWIARVCGLDADIVDPAQVRSSLAAIHRYNLRHDLSDHANPQRPSFALGHEGGLLLCSWPQGGKPALPFVYSDEVWTGFEYQAAAHMLLVGLVDEGLEIVRTARDRYDGRVRNPFNEYECGHWYARAMSSYGLLQGLTGVRYDAVDKTLYIDSRVGDSFRSFLCTAGGFGTVGLEHGQPFLEVRAGRIDIDRVIVSGQPAKLRRTP